MITLKKLAALGLSSLTAMCLLGAVPSAYASQYDCDVNGDGVTNVADAVSLSQYLMGYCNLAKPEVADFNNDGFINKADVIGIQCLGIGIQPTINAAYTPSKTTVLKNSKMKYNRYNARGLWQEDYEIEAAPTISSSSSRIVIGNDDRVEDYSNSAICKIVTNSGTSTGFVASRNSILTAGHSVKGSQIFSITFYDSEGNETSFKPNVLSYSVPENYKAKTDTDYALITVSDDLSAYNNFYMGYALQYAIDTKADVYVTGYQWEDHKEIETALGRLKNTGNANQLYYDCDTVGGVSGGPIYADLIFQGEHYYTVVGINTSHDEEQQYNYGVRMCPNITSLIRYNLD